MTHFLTTVFDAVQNSSYIPTNGNLFVRKFWLTVRKKCSIDEEKRLLILDIFPGPTALLNALRLLNFGFFSVAYRYFQV